MNLGFIYILYLLAIFSFSIALTALMRRIALRFKVLDYPNTDVKTHTEPVPYFGGLSVWLSIMLGMVLLRLFTKFPTGTLHTLRGFVFGSILIVILGIIDDLHIKGVNFVYKFLIQFLAAGILIYYDIRFLSIAQNWLSVTISILWIVGITNSVNLIDIMDGLSGAVAAIASFGFFIISLPTSNIHINFLSVALIGGCLGFMPFNLSKRHRIFLGDTGSLFIGFTLSALSLGTSFTAVNRIGVFAPIMVLAIPIYETILVTYHRFKKGKSPFKGSKDHFALRMEKLGFSRKKILLLTVAAALILAIFALISTRIPGIPALGFYIIVGCCFIIYSRWIGKVEID